MRLVRYLFVGSAAALVDIGLFTVFARVLGYNYLIVAACTFIVATGVNYGLSEHLSLGLGLLVRSRLEDNGQVLPIPSLDWQFAEKWNLSTHTGVSGTGLTLSYKPFEQLTLSLDGSYSSREYRLDDSGAAPKGVARDLRVPVTFAAAWNFSRQVAVTANVGLNAYQEYTLIDNNSNDLAKIKTKPAPFIGASVVISF